MKQIIKSHWDKIIFCISILILILITGIILGHYQIFPGNIVIKLINIIQDPTDFGKRVEQTINIRPSLAITETDQKEGGVIKYLPEKAQNGVTLIVFMGKKYFDVKLINMEGKVLHKWDIPFSKVHYSDAKDLPDSFIEIGSALLYPNGDLLLCHQYKGLVKIDKDSNIIWKKPFGSHHLIYKDKEGNIWTPALKGEKVEYPMMDKKIVINNPEYILKLSPDGEILERINLIEAINKSDLKGLWGVHAAFLLRMESDSPTKEIVMDGQLFTHLNDIEIVEKPAFFNIEPFEEGDIFVSLKHTNTIMLIDKDTHKVKWFMSNPFLLQHDPDLLDNGKISIFDNLGGGTSDMIESQSRILLIDPLTKKVETIYNKEGEKDLYSCNRGNHQFLQNGNLLINESNRGHLIELDPKGEVVWEYYEKWDDKNVSIISLAERYPLEYAEFIK